MKVYQLDSKTLASMRRTDLSSVDQETAGPIGEFSFNGCTGGIGCFIGSPPWERHDDGDELLHVLGGETELTILDGPVPKKLVLRAGALAIVPRGHWHRNNARSGVIVLFLTPSEHNQHSFDDPIV